MLYMSKIPQNKHPKHKTLGTKFPEHKSLKDPLKLFPNNTRHQQIRMNVNLYPNISHDSSVLIYVAETLVHRYQKYVQSAPRSVSCTTP